LIAVELVFLDREFSVLKLGNVPELDFNSGMFFLAKTGDGVTLVCETERAPEAVACERGWTGFYIDGELDFSLVGILAGITGILAGEGIAVFAVSVYETDYVFIKKENAGAARRALEKNGYVIKNVMGDV